MRRPKAAPAALLSPVIAAFCRGLRERQTANPAGAHKAKMQAGYWMRNSWLFLPWLMQRIVPAGSGWKASVPSGCTPFI